jgi:hypothetical protein
MHHASAPLSTPATTYTPDQIDLVKSLLDHRLPLDAIPASLASFRSRLGLSASSASSSSESPDPVSVGVSVASMAPEGNLRDVQGMAADRLRRIIWSRDCMQTLRLRILANPHSDALLTPSFIPWVIKLGLGHNQSNPSASARISELARFLCTYNGKPLHEEFLKARQFDLLTSYLEFNPEIRKEPFFMALALSEDYKAGLKKGVSCVDYLKERGVALQSFKYEHYNFLAELHKLSYYHVVPSGHSRILHLLTCPRNTWVAKTLNCVLDLLGVDTYSYPFAQNLANPGHSEGLYFVDAARLFKTIQKAAAARNCVYIIQELHSFAGSVTPNIQLPPPPVVPAASVASLAFMEVGAAVGAGVADSAPKL